MKHLHNGRTLSRTAGPRKALIKGLLKSLILHEKIKTTEAKAKEVRPYVERLITKGKKGDLHNRRQILSVIGDQLLTEKVMTHLAPKFKERAGGYTRITKIGMRPGDAARMAVIEFVD